MNKQDLESDMHHKHGGLRKRMNAALRSAMGMDEDRPVEIDPDGNIVRRALRQPRLTVLRDERGEYAL